MKRVLLIFLLGLLYITSMAQKYRDSQFHLGGGVGLTYPMGDFSNVASGGVSGNVEGRWIVNRRIAVGFEMGFSQYSQKDSFWEVGNRGENDVVYQIVPMLFSGIYTMDAWDRDFHPYLSLSFGYYWFRNHVQFTSSNRTEYPFNGDPSLEYTINSNRIGLAPTVGFWYDLSDRIAFEMKMRYTYIPSFPKSLTVRQKYTNVASGYEDSRDEENYSLGFTQLTSLTVSLGLSYKF